MHPLADQLHHHPFPQLSQALRARAEPIADSWMEVVHEVMPQMQRLNLEELRNTIPNILEAIAVGLESESRDDLQQLLEQAPEHGFARFATEHSLLDMFAEQRLLRGVIVVEIEQQLDHQINATESAALHATIDLMVQQASLSMVEKQKEQLRAAAEGEVKFMEFLSHDLSNNLFIINTALDHIKHQIQSMSECKIDLESLTTAQQVIGKTTHGMRRLLEHERLRKSGEKPTIKRLNLLDIADTIAKQFQEAAHRKGLRVEVQSQQPREELTAGTDEDLLGLVLRNLVDNAVKYSERGTVQITVNRIQADNDHPNGWRISVADQGPGIKPEQRERIFEAFKRGEAFGHKGIGLGLAIASQAARLLDGQLTVESKTATLEENGEASGSTFSLSLPQR